MTEEQITDGFGNWWPRYCPQCGADMHVQRPGVCICSEECFRYEGYYADNVEDDLLIDDGWLDYSDEISD